MSWNNGMAFSTSDRDHDELSDNCAAYHGGANWWGGGCGWNNINGKYGGNGDIGEYFMFWFDFDDNEMSLKSMTLMFRQAD